MLNNKVKKCSLYFGNSGTTSRFLIPVLALQKGEINYKINCDDRMKCRPMKNLFKILRKIVGKSIIFNENKYQLPIEIKEGKLNNDYLGLNIHKNESSQIISGLLMAFITLKNREEYNINIGSNPISMNFINLTTFILYKFGYIIDTKNIDNEYILKFNSRINVDNKIININTDITSASYPIIYALLNKINLFIPNVKVNTLDTVSLNIPFINISTLLS